MQITIVQAEIEVAIRDYILSQINVREGMEITMELNATRGNTGFTAVIDISAAKPTHTQVVTTSTEQSLAAARAIQEANVVTHVAAQAETTPKVVTIEGVPAKMTFPSLNSLGANKPQTAAQVGAALQAEYDAEEKAEAERAATETLNIVEVDMAKTFQIPSPNNDTVPTIGGAAAVVTAEPVTEEETPRKPPPSLFKNLRKPVNA